MNRYLVASTYGRFCIKFPQSRMKGERHRLSWASSLYWGFMVFNATFNNISVIWWLSVLLMEETGENHWPATSHWQTLTHNVVLSTRVGFELTLVVIDTECICSNLSYESNYHTHFVIYPAPHPTNVTYLHVCFNCESKTTLQLN